MADVEALCENIILILKGEKRFEGSVEEFKTKFRKEKTIIFNFDKKVLDFPADWEESFHCEWSQDRSQLKIRVPEQELPKVTTKIFKSISCE